MNLHINQNTLPAPLDQRLHDLIDASLDAVAPAVSLAVIHEGSLVLDLGAGVIDPATGTGDVTPATRFDLASLTKVFTATCCLALVSREAAALDDPLVRTIPEFGAITPRLTADGESVDPAHLTLRHLLIHTAGLARSRGFYQTIGNAPTPPDQPDPLSRDARWSRSLAALCDYPFVAQPGAAVYYSDIGMLLLGEAATRRWYAGDVIPPQTHLGLDMMIWEGICERLELESPCFNPVRNGVDRRSIAPTEFDAAWRQRRVWGEVHDENAAAVGGVAGHAGMFATAADVARFGQAWLDRDPRLKIDRALMDEAVRQQVASGSKRHGLGWILRAPDGSSAGERFSPDTYGHTGFTGTSLWIDPQRALVVALLTNRVYSGRDPGAIHAFRRAIHDLLAEL